MNNMVQRLVKQSDKDSKTATDFLKSIKENKNVGLTSKDLIHFLYYFNFIEPCKNDKYINTGYKPKKNFLKKNLIQFDVCEILDGDKIHKKNYTPKFTKEGQNYLMPFVLNLMELKNTAKSVKKQ